MRGVVLEIEKKMANFERLCQWLGSSLSSQDLHALPHLQLPRARAWQQRSSASCPMRE